MMIMMTCKDQNARPKHRQRKDAKTQNERGDRPDRRPQSNEKRTTKKNSTQSYNVMNVMHKIHEVCTVPKLRWQQSTKQKSNRRAEINIQNRRRGGAGAGGGKGKERRRAGPRKVCNCSLSVQHFLLRFGGRREKNRQANHRPKETVRSPTED